MKLKEKISKFIDSVIKKTFLKTFYSIELSNIEKEIAQDSIKFKYKPCIFNAIISGILIIPAILILDTNTLMSVLIPITMVVGSAWFAISLANMKKKFEDFGLELTTNMFEGFVTSLVMLGLLTLFSLMPNSLFAPITVIAKQYFIVCLISGILGTIVIFKLLFLVFAGALKYDINDAMLTGQNEAAERYFKKSLSLLHTASENLRAGKGIEVANYYIGLSFYEIFAFIQSAGLMNGQLKGLMDGAHKLKRTPDMGQEEADKIALDLIRSFVSYCKNVEGVKAKKSFENIKEEFNCIENNENEPQAIVDTRLSTIVEEIAELLELEGESLFKERKN
ncbi:MAG: hypothetical protein KAI55_01490 [Candidatus Aenigmarchaeota archaeon]|nr:hypothetical protein [Candidatus Aenigmarchaeota archaeon]